MMNPLVSHPPAIPGEQSALLRAIVAHPDDDAPRLVYADWLEEHDDEEQAEFIRDSIRLAGLEKGEERKELAEQLRALVDKRCHEWLAPLGVNGLVSLDRYHRGFPFRVWFGSQAKFFAAADVLFAFVPVRGLGIDGGDFDEDTLPRFAAMRELLRITDLRLFDHSRVTPIVWREFFRSPNLCGLTHLTLGNCGLYESEAVELASAPALANLTDLDLGYNSIGADGAWAILRSPYFAKLKTLWLYHNFFGEEEEDEVIGALEERFGAGLHLDDSPYDEDEELT